MNEALTRRLLLPAHERMRGRGTLRFYRELKANDGKSADEMLSLQFDKLRRLVVHAVDKVPWYRPLAARFDPAAPRTLTREVYAAFPVLEKDDVRGNLDSFRAQGYSDRLIPYSTGGSTGDPLVFYTDKDKEAHHKAQDWRCRSWFGVEPGDRQVDLWGSPIELQRMTGFRKWKDARLLNHIVLSAFDLHEDRVGDYVNLFREFEPRLIYGYPSVLSIVAQFMLDRGIELGEAAPKLVSCTSEMMYPMQRDLIEAAFGCPVANEYGARDGGLIAHECPAGRMHIAAEHVLLEVDEPDADGVGRLLVTNLDGYGMPFLRYEIGDLGALRAEACTCGIALPLLGEIRGRSNDFVIGAGNTRVHALAPIYALRPYRRKLRQFKVVQRRDLSLEIRFACVSPLTDAELEQIRAAMRRVLDMPVEVVFVFVEHIEPERSGKHRAVVCEADTDRGPAL